MIATDSPDEIPVMVAISRAISKPQFKCVLVDKKKRFAVVFQELESEDDDRSSGAPSVKVSSSETGTIFPFNDRVTIDQASKMLRSDILWVNFEYPEVMRVPPPGIRNAFEVLKKASSLPRKAFQPSTQNQSMDCLSYLINWLIFAKTPTFSSGKFTK